MRGPTKGTVQTVRQLFRFVIGNGCVFTNIDKALRIIVCLLATNCSGERFVCMQEETTENRD